MSQRPPPRLAGYLLVIGLGFAALAMPAARASDLETERLSAAGEQILAEKCARCHATGKSGDSPLVAAPPFRTLGAKYPLDSLAEALAEGITTGHPEMPEFVFSTDEIAAILAYMDRISDAPARK